MTDDTSAQNGPICSDERLRGVLRRQIHIAVNVTRSIRRDDLARESGVNVHTIDAITTTDPAKQRKVKLADALSIAAVLGEGCVNALLSEIGFSGAKPVGEGEQGSCTKLAAKALQGVTVLVSAAADGVIDHTEEPAVRDAADMLIATVMPYSSAGRRA